MPLVDGNGRRLTRGEVAHMRSRNEPTPVTDDPWVLANHAASKALMACAPPYKKDCSDLDNAYFTARDEVLLEHGIDPPPRHKLPRRLYR